MGSSQPTATDRHATTAEEFTALFVPSAIGATTWSRVLRNDPCCWCGVPRGGTVEHIQPRSRNGSDKPTNLAGACRTCNSTRGKNSFLNWMMKRQWMER